MIADTLIILKKNRLYLHIFSWPFKHLHLKGMAGKIEYAQLLNDASEVKMKAYNRDTGGHGQVCTEDSTLTLELPVKNRVWKSR